MQLSQRLSPQLSAKQWTTSWRAGITNIEPQSSGQCPQCLGVAFTGQHGWQRRCPQSTAYWCSLTWSQQKAADKTFPWRWHCCLGQSIREKGIWGKVTVDRMRGLISDDLRSRLGRAPRDMCHHNTLDPIVLDQPGFYRLTLNSFYLGNDFW